MFNQKIFVVITLGAALICTAAMASGIQCRDSSGDLSYTTFAADGGACCGHTTTTLAYKGKVLKHVDTHGTPAGQSDSNSNLHVRESAPVDMNNNVTTQAARISNYAINLTLTTGDGSLPYPEAATSPATISLICTDTEYVGPPIPQN